MGILVIVPRQPRQNAELERIAQNLHQLAEYAESLNVKLVIEPMSRFRTHLIHSAQEAVNLVSMVQHPNLFINLDTYHMITEERNYANAIKICGNALWGIHACESDRGVPGGGLVPWDDIFCSLADVCPNARILMETYNTGTMGFGYKRGIFKDVCPNAPDFVTNGLKFVKQRVESLNSAKKHSAWIRLKKAILLVLGWGLSKPDCFCMSGDIEFDDYRTIKAESEERINRLEAILATSVTETTNIEPLWNKAISPY